VRLSRAVTVVASLAVLLSAAGCSQRATPGQLRSWNDELARLQATQDSLRARSAELVANDPRLRRIPKGDVVISVPTDFIRRMLRRVFDDVAGNVTLSLTGLKAHVAKSVKKGIPIGEFVLDIDIQEVTGTLKPGRPEMDFGGNRVAMSLPVDVNEGHGEALLHFVWHGKNVAGMTCGDLDVTQEVDGSVIPSRYVVTGGMGLAVRGSKIVCTPAFPETRILIRVKPSESSWAVVDSILAEKHGVCGWVLDKVDVPSMLEGLVQEKGFQVRLPVHKIPSFVLPAGVRDTVAVGERRLALDTRTNLLRIDRDAVWYSADVSVKPQ
jgi:hypothetical protein